MDTYDFIENEPLFAISQVVESIGCKLFTIKEELGDQPVCAACHQSIMEKTVLNEHSPVRCNGCSLGISPTDMVYTLKVDVTYHVNCHRCFQCCKQLSPGDQIVIDEETRAVACHHHYQDNEESVFEEFFDILPTKNIKTSLSPNILSIIPQYPFEMYSYGELCSEDKRLLKRRGPRTTIKQSQLDVLNDSFQKNPKPSKHDRAKLSLEAGLSMRVIQIWHQNKRSKERRLKHLCNFLRHCDQTGIAPSQFSFNHSDALLRHDEGFSSNNLNAIEYENCSLSDNEELSNE
uniref:Homeobox domain-containing protein n=1 Tax=Rhabditophanes sp. KR3021 TaxID=114890 RepID=A0AC35UCZ9_9BILA